MANFSASLFNMSVLVNGFPSNPWGTGMFVQGNKHVEPVISNTLNNETMPFEGGNVEYFITYKPNTVIFKEVCHLPIPSSQ